MLRPALLQSIGRVVVTQRRYREPSAGEEPELRGRYQVGLESRAPVSPRGGVPDREAERSRARSQQCAFERARRSPTSARHRVRGARQIMSRGTSLPATPTSTDESSPQTSIRRPSVRACQCAVRHLHHLEQFAIAMAIPGRRWRKLCLQPHGEFDCTDMIRRQDWSSRSRGYWVFNAMAARPHK